MPGNSSQKEGTLVGGCSAAHTPSYVSTRQDFSSKLLGLQLLISLPPPCIFDSQMTHLIFLMHIKQQNKPGLELKVCSTLIGLFAGKPHFKLITLACVIICLSLPLRLPLCLLVVDSRCLSVIQPYLFPECLICQVHAVGSC